jgi:hypothetical protein
MVKYISIHLLSSSSTSTTCCLDLFCKESVAFLLRRACQVREMAGIDIKLATANAVGSGTEDLYVFRGVVWHFATILLVVGVSVQRNADDSLLDVFWERRNGVENNGSSLTVITDLARRSTKDCAVLNVPETTCYHNRLWALCARRREMLRGLGNR